MDKAVLKFPWQNQADCRQCAIRHLVLFSGLEESDFDLIHRPIDTLQLENGQTLYCQGDKAHALFTVRHGLVKLVQYAADGNQRIVRLLRTGDVMGLEALVGHSYDHDAVVLQQATLCRLPVDLVRSLDRESPHLHTELMRRWQHALSEADAWLTQLSTGPARTRVARLLLRLTDPATQACTILGREDMGAMLGITTETASRTVAAFKREGIVTEGHGAATHCDLAKLQEIADD